MSPRTCRAPSAISAPPMSVDGSTMIVSAVRVPIGVAQQAGEHRTEERTEQEHVDADHRGATRPEPVGDDRRHDGGEDHERGLARTRCRPRARARRPRCSASRSRRRVSTPNSATSKPTKAIAAGGLRAEQRVGAAPGDGDREQGRDRDDRARTRRAGTRRGRARRRSTGSGTAAR